MTTRARRSIVTAVGAVAAVALPLTGCGTPFDRNDPATTPTSTSAPDSSPSPESSSASPSASSSTGKDAGRELTRAETKGALPARPRAADTVPAATAPAERQTDPAVCIDVLRRGGEAIQLDKVEIAAAEKAWFVRGSGDGTRYDVEVRSFSRPVGPTLLDRAGAAMSDCGAFALYGKDKSGSFDDRVLTGARAAPALGEQSFATRLTTFVEVDGTSKRLHADYLVVRVGHNLVQVSQTHWDETASFDQLEDYARGILDKLEETP